MRLNVIYKPIENQATQMDHHKKLDTADEKKLNEDWREKIRFNAEYGRYGYEFKKMWEELEEMKDGHLDRITVYEDRIGLYDAETWPIYLAPYRAGLRTKEFERWEIYKMLLMGAIEPALT